MPERTLEWSSTRRRAHDILWRISIVALGAAVFFLANGAAAGEAESPQSPLSTDTAPDPLCSSLRTLLDAGPAFQSIRGDGLDADRWKATRALPGAAECHIATTLAGGADLACLMYRAQERSPVEQRYESTLKSVRACLSGWSEADATNPVDIRATELRHGDTAARVRVRLIDATISHRLVITVSS